MGTDLSEVRGFRGERIVELCLTEYGRNERPLFRPGFLGDKWPAIDFYIELKEVAGKRLYFFAQAKATASYLNDASDHLSVTVRKADVDRLLRVPGPTYILGVHEPSKRVFVRSVHEGVPVRAITRIPLSHELTRANLLVLHQEVREFWLAVKNKPSTSVFA
ncbi:MAG TPA: DUF4365 domain-containing protein [Longimicrobium sp.]|jgi:hypothetical protein